MRANFEVIDASLTHLFLDLQSHLESFLDIEIFLDQQLSKTHSTGRFSYIGEEMDFDHIGFCTPCCFLTFQPFQLLRLS